MKVSSRYFCIRVSLTIFNQGDLQLKLQHLQHLRDLHIVLSPRYSNVEPTSEEKRRHNNAVIDAIATLPLCVLDCVFLDFTLGYLMDEQCARLDALLSERLTTKHRVTLVITDVCNLYSQFPRCAQRLAQKLTCNT